MKATTKRKIWIGRSFLGIAALHTIAAGFFCGKILLDVVHRGVYDTVHDHATIAAVWFLLFGAVMALFGMAVNALERNEHFPAARGIGIGCLLLTVVGVVLMPASGFWLAIPPTIGLLRVRS